jgi:hypothetical protein
MSSFFAVYPLFMTDKKFSLANAVFFCYNKEKERSLP